jgi:hypothetical protein
MIADDNVGRPRVKYGETVSISGEGCAGAPGKGYRCTAGVKRKLLFYNIIFNSISLPAAA